MALTLVGFEGQADVDAGEAAVGSVVLVDGVVLTEVSDPRNYAWMKRNRLGAVPAQVHVSECPTPLHKLNTNCVSEGHLVDNI